MQNEQKKTIIATRQTIILKESEVKVCESCGQKLKARSLNSVCERCFIKNTIYCIYCTEERNGQKNYLSHKECDQIIETINTAKEAVKR